MNATADAMHAVSAVKNAVDFMASSQEDMVIWSGVEGLCRWRSLDGCVGAT